MDDKTSALVLKMLQEMTETAEAEAQIDGDPGKLGIAVGLGVALAIFASVQEEVSA